LAIIRNDITKLRADAVVNAANTRLQKYHGFETTLHELRYTLISIAKAGLSAELLKPMVGHAASMDTFGVYGHEVDGEMQLVADTLDSLFDKYLKAEKEEMRK